MVETGSGEDERWDDGSSVFFLKKGIGYFDEGISLHL